MYSRIPSRRIPRPPRPRGEPSYRRAPVPPPNYGGTVFSPPSDAQDAPEISAPLPLTPEKTEKENRDVSAPMSTFFPTSPPDADETPVSSEETVPVAASPSGFPSLFRRNHFPLGHGLGQEEILLLGLLFLLLMEGNAVVDGDDDLGLTLLLLGVLLLCG